MRYIKQLLVIAILFNIKTTKCECPKIVTRQEWNASEAREKLPLPEIPAPYVMIHHLNYKQCYSILECKKNVQKAQNLHMNTFGWEDIGYHFLIGGDGSIFEGKGWGIYGSHCVSFNGRSIGICLIGNFDVAVPTNHQLNALQSLISCGVETKQVTEDYRLVGHRQGFATKCPGDHLFEIIKKWPHFDPNPDQNSTKLSKESNSSSSLNPMSIFELIFVFLGYFIF